MAGTGQRHIQQAHILTQAVSISGADAGGIGLQVQVALARRIGPGHQLGTGRGDGAKAGGKGQKHQRIFQPFGLVHRDHLDQVGVTFQPHDLLVGGGCSGAVYLAGQPAQQCLLTVLLGAGGLQQLGQVQHVGQAAFPAAVDFCGGTPVADDAVVINGFFRAVVRSNVHRNVHRLGQPARRQAQPVQGLAQHGQHALLLPDHVQLAQQLGAGIKGFVVGRQVGQLGQRQTHQPGGQCGAGQLRITR